MDLNTIHLNFQEEVETTVSVLQKGGSILYPTDTIWGLGCDALNKSAVEQVFKVKERDPSKKLIVLVASIPQLNQYVGDIHPRVNNLLAYTTRPVTVIYEPPILLPSYLLEKDGSIAIRVIKDPFCQALINGLGRPILATSANISGEPFPNSFSDISPRLIKGVDYVVNHRRDEESSTIPSVIVKLSEKDELIFLRN